MPSITLHNHTKHIFWHPGPAGSPPEPALGSLGPPGPAGSAPGPALRSPADLRRERPGTLAAARHSPGVAAHGEQCREHQVLYLGGRCREVHGCAGRCREEQWEMQCITPVVGSCDEPHVVEHVVDPSPRPRYPCPPSQSSSSPSPRLVVDLEGEADELEGEDEDGGVGVGRGCGSPREEDTGAAIARPSTMDTSLGTRCNRWCTAGATQNLCRTQLSSLCHPRPETRKVFLTSCTVVGRPSPQARTLYCPAGSQHRPHPPPSPIPGLSWQPVQGLNPPAPSQL